jgi:endo-1,4-beta-D-glucanase Y
MRFILSLFLLWSSFATASTIVPISEQTVQAEPWNLDLSNALTNVWHGIVSANNDREPFLIHRPYSETAGDAVSEGVGYGLLMALFLDDEATFHRLFEGAESTMWNGRCYDWRVDQYNHRSAFGAATDAEQDIAAALLMAHEKIVQGNWTLPENRYAQRAQTIMDNLWNQGITWQGTLRPGYGWGGDDFVNVGYFAPAWYRLFHRMDEKKRDWMRVVDRSYFILKNSPGYDLGLVPDWMTPDGQWTSNLGYNAYGDGHYMYKDAIRTLWRIGTDYLWFGDERALEYLGNARFFLEHIYNGIQSANFFRMDGTLVPETDVWVFDDGHRQRGRREHSPLTIGMWGITIFLLGSPEEQEAVVHELLKFYQPNATYWGLDTNPEDPGETTAHNEMYFEQFLGSFGALIFCGLWTVAP